MDNGGRCVMIGLDCTMLTWLVDSWGTPEATAGGQWVHWGEWSECVIVQQVLVYIRTLYM